MPDKKNISEGDSFTCPQCHSASIARMESEYDGLTIKRKFLVCAFCRTELPSPAKEKNTGKRIEKRVDQKKLSLLFGDSQAPEEPVIADLLADDHERRFCKNCRHNFITPFKCHCNLHHKEVEPLQDCPDFEPKKKLSSL
ncbi:MAG: hypothetical protein WCT05_13920 [Lentisphaeria bacterium]